MGVQCCHYVMVAAKFDYQTFKEAVFTKNTEWDLTEKYEDNAYREDVGSYNDLTIIIDGMSGEYVFFGVVFAKGLDGLDVIDCDEAAGYKKEVWKKIYREFRQLKIDLPIDVRVYAFTHWH